MTGVPQVIVTISPSGGLVVELPGFQASRRKIELRSGEAEATLLRILENQAQGAVEIGLDGAPTAKQVEHWERHQVWPREGCRWCRQEGRLVGPMSSQRRRELVSDGTVQVRRLAPGASGIEKPKKKVRPAVVVRQVGKRPTGPDDLGL